MDCIETIHRSDTIYIVIPLVMTAMRIFVTFNDIIGNQALFRYTQ